ncbi:MAG: type II toxin-antitoxin system HicB family antitoxin [Dehalococcoidia bacterium]
MQLLTIVEDYVLAALRRAIIEQLEDGTVGASIPECPGVLAFGADVHKCARELYARLEDWVRVSLERGNELPVIDGINLNTEASQILASYHPGAPIPRTGTFYANEEELEAAFAEMDKES